MSWASSRDFPILCQVTKESSDEDITYDFEVNTDVEPIELSLKDVAGSLTNHRSASIKFDAHWCVTEKSTAVETCVGKARYDLSVYSLSLCTDERLCAVKTWSKISEAALHPYDKS